MQIGGKQLDFGSRTYMMGVLNVTPDSFSDGGEFNELEKAVLRCEELEALGADIVDIGGESTRTKIAYGQGVTSTALEEELSRVVPVIEKAAKILSVPISIDTYKAAVARAAANAGAAMVNDVWGLQKDPDMASVVADLGLPVVMMHNQEEPIYTGDIMDAIYAFLDRSLQLAENAGILRENMILDPGICFGKTYEQSVEVMARISEFRSHYKDFPILVGTSRKSMIGGLTGRKDFKERIIGTTAANVYAVSQAQADIVRVHDISENMDALKVVDRITRGLDAWTD